MPFLVITGGNRGIGLELVRQLSQMPHNYIVTTVRSFRDKDKLAQLNDVIKRAQPYTSVHVQKCDTSDEGLVAQLAHDVKVLADQNNGGKVDFLINNAGVNSVPDRKALDFTSDELHREIDVNVMGPALMTRKFLERDLLSNGSTVMNMSSCLGSCGKRKPVSTVYSLTKAAVNMLTVHQAAQLEEKGIKVICMDPGTVQTDMGGDDAPLTPEESVLGMLEVLRGTKHEDSGKFFMYDGSISPW